MINTHYCKSDVSVVRTTYFLSYMPVFYKVANIKIGNCNINNFLAVRSNKGRSVTSIHYVQSVSHNVDEQGPLLLVFILPQEV